MSKSHHTRELVVLGAGPGGYAAAFRAADLGVKVTLIDEAPNPGGVCLYRGCIPSKALLHVAKLIKETQQAQSWGIRFGPPEIDLDQLRDWKDGVVSKLTRGLGSLCKKRKIEYIRGIGTFTGHRALTVEDKENNTTEEIAFEKAIIATGARNVTLPNLPTDSPLIMDSTSSLEIRDIPKTLLVIGGGYIGLEQANIYARLGSRVTVVEMAPQLLPGSDQDIASLLKKYLSDCFEAIMLNTKVTRCEPTDNGLQVDFDGDGQKPGGQTYDKILVAVGRKPNTDGIGLEHTDVEMDDKGFIVVDEQRQTSDAAIFAIGDVTGNPQFAHKATHEGRVAAETIAGRPAAFDPRVIPFVEYTELEIAGCGLSERQAHEQGLEVETATFPWAASGRALTMGQDKGFTKLVLDRDTGRILGMAIAGSDAGKLISEGALAIEMGAVAQDLAHTIHPHPTLSETLMEAAGRFLKESVHI